MKEDQEQTTNILPKKHGLFLTLFMVLTGFGAIAAFFTLLNPTILRATYSEIPSWLNFYTAIGGIFSAGVLYGVLKWKKWTIYLYIFSSILAVVMQAFVLPQYSNILQGATAIPTALIGAFWFWVIYRKRKNFK